MKLSIADLTIEIKNCNYDYIINKTRKYQSGSVGPADMTINCFLVEEIAKPEGKTIGDVEGWNWCIADNGEIYLYHIYGKNEIDFASFLKTFLFILCGHAFFSTFAGEI